MSVLKVDIAVIGGGLGGVAAAIAAASYGRSVVLVEETDWLGGQLTTQGVPPDEHPWIEQFGATRTYRHLRDSIRRYYMDNYPVSATGRRARYFNPGAGAVSKLCHEPQVAVAVLDQMVAPFVTSGRLTILRRHEAISADVAADRVVAIGVRDLDTGAVRELVAAYFIDATECGDLLPLTGTEYVSGAESREDTGEPHAPAIADPLNMQAFSVCFAVDHLEGEDHTIERPAQYDKWRSFAPIPWSPLRLLDWNSPDPGSLVPRVRRFDPNPDDDPSAVIADQSVSGGDDDLWKFRRILARQNFETGFLPSDVVLVNWPLIDYMETPLFEEGPDAAANALASAKQLSLSVLYWMQTEAPRSDGCEGLPGLRLRSDVMQTKDGLAKRPYVRESRRILALTRVCEQDVSSAIRAGRGATKYADSVGIGCYRIDLHPSTGGDNYIQLSAEPFQIPLRALIPQRTRNLIAANKNIGTTHITNGCYRLHPVEWNIGEAAGTLAAFCIDQATEPQAVAATASLTADLQRMLIGAGVELSWPDVRAY
jgi:hypothetical protein